MPTHISLSDIACSSRSISVFGSRLEPVSCVSDWVVRVVGFDPRSGPAQPNPTRPGPARPWRPHPPMRPLLHSRSHLDLPRNNLPLPLPPLSPRGALGIGDGDHRNLDPEVSSPPRPAASLSLFLPFPSLHAPISLPCARRSPAPPRPCARQRPPLPHPGAAAAPAPHPGPRRRSPPAPTPPPPRPRRGSAPARPRLPARGLGPCARRPGPRRGSRGLGVASRSPFTPSAFPRAQPHTRGDYSCFFVSFKTPLVSVLRRALRRATIPLVYIY
jgi:hypothetical protein